MVATHTTTRNSKKHKSKKLTLMVCLDRETILHEPYNQCPTCGSKPKVDHFGFYCFKTANCKGVLVA